MTEPHTSALPEGTDAPLILLDALPMAFKLDVWRRLHDPSHEQYGWATLRLGELIRALDPGRSLALAEEAQELGVDPARVAALRTVALLESGRADEAAIHLNGVASGPHRALLEARLLLLRGQLERGLEGLVNLLATPDLPADVHAEALSFKARAHPEDGKQGALDDLALLEELAIAENATITGVWIGLWRKLVQSEGFATAARVLTANDLARRLTALTEGLDIDPVSLGPVPVHVHAVFVRYRQEPAQATKELIELAGLFWQAGLQSEAHRTAVFARRIGARLLGGQAAKDLADYEQVLRHHAGEESWEAFTNALKREESDFVNQAQP